MPRANWGINSRTVRDFDRDAQYKPYSGPQPPNGVYQFRVKKAQSIRATKGKLPQLRVGLELVPRNGRKDDRRYKGYWIMMFAPVADNTAFRYVPFLDAIGVSETDFTRRTMTDEEGNIKRIGQWKNDGETLVLAQIADDEDQNGKPTKKISWIGEVTDEDEYDDDDEESDEDGDDDDDDDEDDEWDDD